MPTSANRTGVIGYATNRVVGTVVDGDKAKEAIDALLRAGFERDDIDILHGEEDVHRLDPTGAEHGFLAQFHRTLIRTFELEEFKHLTHHVEDVRAGRYVVMVLTRRRAQRIVAADILHQYGAEFVGFYGRWAWEDLPPTPKATPADVPALFARAWNARNADAIASLFDDEAEVIDESGLCCHDRDSIRQRLASRLERVGDTTLAAEETRVRVLSPEVSMVHARMTRSGENGGASIVTFVVHRAGDRWVCASAHSTDIHPDDDGRGLGSARQGVARSV